MENGHIRRPVLEAERMVQRFGRTVPLHATSTGKAYLADPAAYEPRPGPVPESVKEAEAKEARAEAKLADTAHEPEVILAAEEAEPQKA